MLNKKNIILIGFMGSGKSTVGRILANILFFDFLDTDEIIEKKLFNNKIDKIFYIYGENFFRKLESKTLSIINKKINTIIATGGGFPIYQKKNFLKSIGLIFYLKASPEILFERVKKSENRPLLSSFFQIYKKRKKIYEKLSDFVIDTDFLLPEEVAFKIRSIYENYSR